MTIFLSDWFCIHSSSEKPIIKTIHLDCFNFGDLVCTHRLLSVLWTHLHHLDITIALHSPSNFTPYSNPGLLSIIQRDESHWTPLHFPHLESLSLTAYPPLVIKLVTGIEWPEILDMLTVTLINATDWYDYDPVKSGQCCMESVSLHPFYKLAKVARVRRVIIQCQCDEETKHTTDTLAALLNHTTGLSVESVLIPETSWGVREPSWSNWSPADDIDGEDVEDTEDTETTEDSHGGSKTLSADRVAERDEFVLADAHLRPWSWEADLIDQLHPGWSAVDT